MLTALCVALVMIGCAILGQFDWRTLRFGRGEAETLLSTLFFTAQILWLEWPVFRGNQSGRVTFAMFATIAIVLAPVAAFHATSWSDAAVLFSSVPVFALFALPTAICSVLAFLWMNHWQPHVDATSAGIIYCAEPLFATAFALFVPALLGPWVGVPYANETFTQHLIVGGSLITAANVAIAWRPPHDG